MVIHFFILIWNNGFRFDMLLLLVGLIQVTFSMLEIYNENVRDLLDSNPGKNGLKVRQHPKMGFYGMYFRSHCLSYMYLFSFDHWQALLPVFKTNHVTIVWHSWVSLHLKFKPQWSRPWLSWWRGNFQCSVALMQVSNLNCMLSWP